MVEASGEDLHNNCIIHLFFLLRLLEQGPVKQQDSG